MKQQLMVESCVDCAAAINYIRSIAEDPLVTIDAVAIYGSPRMDLHCLVYAVVRGEENVDVCVEEVPQERFKLLLPVPDRSVVSQWFGDNPQIYAKYGLPGHEGFDWAVPEGTPITACADGEVFETTFAEHHVYGHHVRIKHEGGYRTIYAHLSEVLVKEGKNVNAGDVIGKAGSTGNSTGPHLHLTVKREGVTYLGYPYNIIDPAELLGLSR